MDITVGLITTTNLDTVGLREYQDGTFGLTLPIGRRFHWERPMFMRFKGRLDIMKHPDGSMTLINTLPLEEYLASVISSEISPYAPVELLRAHAVVSRSWVLAQIEARRQQAGRPAPFQHWQNGTAPDGDDTQAPRIPPASTTGQQQQFIYWQDRQSHLLYDVCPDDHCQRYQGYQGITAQARAAVQDTAGQVLTYDGQVCDARFSKCCGGQTEVYRSCWDDRDVPYLTSVPCPYCDTHDLDLLYKALKGYDVDTGHPRCCLTEHDRDEQAIERRDFYEWDDFIFAEELDNNIHQRCRVDIGDVVELIPLERGASPRVTKLKIVGTRGTIVIGKELTIRQILSRNTLRSSWITGISARSVRLNAPKNDPYRPGDIFRIHGRGWGHGVGLCQIGAAVMAKAGHQYTDILHYYYPEATLEIRK